MTVIGERALSTPVIASAATSLPKTLAKVEAIQSLAAVGFWIASSQELLAMTACEAMASPSRIAVIPREGGESSTLRLLGLITGVSEYWIARLRGR